VRATFVFVKLEKRKVYEKARKLKDRQAEIRLKELLCDYCRTTPIGLCEEVFYGLFLTGNYEDFELRKFLCPACMKEYEINLSEAGIDYIVIDENTENFKQFENLSYESIRTGSIRIPFVSRIEKDAGFLSENPWIIKYWNFTKTVRRS